MRSLRIPLALVVALGAALAHAQPERERIAAERAAASARFAEQERACQERFVVTACVDAARNEHRMTLTRLHRAELVLDESERREAGARRRQLLQERAAGQDARASEPTVEVRRERPRAAPAPNPDAASRPQRSPPSAAEQRASEQRNESAFDAKARAAEARRESVQRRNAQRKREGKVPAPLPVPGASAP